MNIYVYLIIWAFGGCLVGVCIGFFLAAALAGGGKNYEAALSQSLSENDRLVSENAVLVSKLWEIESLINKHFGSK